ncbi:MAG: hypothetical protein ABI542_05350 [Gemmatimonadota bacterium]
MLWVGDLDTCSLVRLDLRTGREVGRKGRCGAGPGEFGNPNEFTILGDSVAIVWDVRLRRMTRLPLRGTADTVTWPGSAFLDTEKVPLISSLVPAGPGEVVFSRDLLPGSSAPLDMWFDTETGQVTGTRFPAPRESWGTRSPTNSHVICRMPGGHIIATTWAHEFVAIDSLGAPLWTAFDSVATPARTIDHLTHQTDGAQVQTSILVQAPVCGSEYFVMRSARLGPATDRGLVFDFGGTLQVWDYRGRLRLDVALPRVPDGDPLLEYAFAWDGAYWFTDWRTDLLTLRRFDVRPGTGKVVRLS